MTDYRVTVLSSPYGKPVANTKIVDAKTPSTALNKVMGIFGVTMDDVDSVTVTRA